MRGIGVPEPPEEIFISPEDYREHKQAWLNSGVSSPEELHKHVLANALWREQSRRLAESERVKAQIVTHKHEHRHVLPKWLIAGFLLLLGLLLYSLLGPKAHAQFSKINSIDFRNNDNSAQGFFTSPFVFKAGSNCSFAPVGTTQVFNCTGGAAAAGGSNTQVQYNSAGALGGISSMTSDGTIVTAKVGTNFNFADPTDATKKVQFDLSGITTATTRTIKIPDAASATAQAISAVAHKFLTSFSQTTGAFTQAQPVCGDLSDSGTLCTSSAALAQTISNVSHKWLNSYTASTGAFTQTQPACGDLSDASAFCNGTGYSNLTGVPSTFAPSAHNLLSAQHSDTVAHTVALGDLIYGNSTPAWQALAGQTSSTKEYLSQTGTGSVSAAPAWAQIAFADLSGSHSCAQSPALTGDVTSSAGSCATALGNIPDLTTQAGSILATNIAAPSTPAAGKTKIYVDSTSKKLCSKDDGGNVNCTGAGGGGTPGGTNTDVQFNNSGIFGGDSGFTYSNANSTQFVNVGGGSSAVVDPGFALTRTITNSTGAGTGNAHGFTNSETFQRSTGGPDAYSAFQVNTLLAGGNAYDHLSGFQFAASINNSGGSLSNLYGFYSTPLLTAGTVSNFYAFTGNDINGTVGNDYFLFVPNITHGSSSNWGIYQQNASLQNYLQGLTSFGDSSFQVNGGVPLDPATFLGAVAPTTVGTTCQTAWIRGYNSGLSYPEVAEFCAGRYKAPSSVEPNTRLDLNLKGDSSQTLTGDMHAMSWGTDGASVFVGINQQNPQYQLDVNGTSSVTLARHKPQAFSALPACSGTTEGETAAVTDSSTATWGATITGSSTTHVLAYCDGTNWTVAGK